MKDLIGKKVKGFKFETFSNGGIFTYFTKLMEEKVGEIGEVYDYNKDAKYYVVNFKDGESCHYPAEIIEQHLVQEYPKVMLVSDINHIKEAKERVVIASKMNKHIAWENAKTIEEAENEKYTYPWCYAWEIEPKVKLTMQDITEGKGTGVPAHLIEIINN